MRRVVAALTTILIALAVFALLVRDGANFQAPEAPTSNHDAQRSLLLITLDTTRADRIGCYGHKEASTPNVDLLATTGTLFEDAISQVPLTLPSHCSMMTGRFPEEHGVRDNGRARLGDGHETLAAILKSRGYATGAFVATDVLHSRYGLNRGFDVYADETDKPRVRALSGPMETKAETVTDRALEWLASVQDQPFFCWVHYYDAHDPYDPPPAFREKTTNPYDGEIAYADSQVGRLTRWLAGQQSLNRTLVVLAGDHGESFGEHGERGHTLFLYRTNLHVPLIFSCPDLIESGQRIPQTVALVDVFPTVLNLLNLPVPDGLLSQSLTPTMTSDVTDGSPVFADNVYALNAFSWARQQAVLTDRWKYIQTTLPELYDRRHDPLEQDNLVDAQPAIVRELKGLLQRHELAMEEEQAPEIFDFSAMRALESLGYVAGSSKASATMSKQDLPDPKEMLSVYKRYLLARGLVREEREDRFAVAIPLIDGLRTESPGSIVFAQMLASSYVMIEDLDSALLAFDEALMLDADYPQALVGRAEVLYQVRRYAEAEEDYRRMVALGFSSSEVLLGLSETLHAQARPDDAIAILQEAAAKFPKHAEVREILAVWLIENERAGEAVAHLSTAVGIDASKVSAQYNLGVAFYRGGQYSKAIEQFREVLRLQPDHGDSAIDLGMALIQVGKLDEAERSFQQALSLPGFQAQAMYGLGVVAARTGNLEETVRQYEQAIAVNASFTPPFTELAAFYAHERRFDDAIRILNIGVDSSPNHVPILLALAKLLATCDQPSLRDGKSAVALAERAAELTKQPSGEVAGVLAAAYAEVGDNENAQRFRQQADRLALKESSNAPAGVGSTPGRPAMTEGSQ